jgi:hypothetical protein
MKPFWKTLTFWISASTWLVLVGGHYAGITPPPYGLVLANVVAVIYATLRCLQKRNTGIPWKSIFLTSEFSGTACTVLVNLLESLMKLPVMSSRALAIISGIISGLLWILHSINGSVKPGQFGIPFEPASDHITTKPFKIRGAQGSKTTHHTPKE